MTFQEITGTYTCRSFLNHQTGGARDLLRDEGELFLRIEPDGAIAGHLAYPSDADAELRDVMTLSGGVKPASDPELTFTAEGLAETALAGVRYSYRCRMAHDWPNAEPDQRPSLVGTVVRDAGHGDAPAGATASFIAVKRDFLEPRQIDGVALIPEAIAMLAEPTHRLRHTVWHSVRRFWNWPALSDQGRAQLRDLGWGIDDPPFNADDELDLENGAGEDFLYMHRRMIAMLKMVYAAEGKAAPAGWQKIPAGLGPQIAHEQKRDPETGQLSHVIDRANSGVMVPAPTAEFMQLTEEQPFLFYNKTAAGFRDNLARLAEQLRNKAFAGSLTLGAYGNLLEFTVHNWMHMRWASIPRDPVTEEPAARALFDISPKWDHADNDFLGDFHSSHVNPVFWKLHGWIDDCIDIWFDAHEELTPGQVKRRDVRGIDWFEQGVWIRKSDPFDWPGASEIGQHRYNGTGSELSVLRKVMALLEAEILSGREASSLSATSLPLVASFLLPGL